jgi:N-glycosylase/DNA lyase
MDSTVDNVLNVCEQIFSNMKFDERRSYAGKVLSEVCKELNRLEYSRLFFLGGTAVSGNSVPDAEQPPKEFIKYMDQGDVLECLHLIRTFISPCRKLLCMAEVLRYCHSNSRAFNGEEKEVLLKINEEHMRILQALRTHQGTVEKFKTYRMLFNLSFQVGLIVATVLIVSWFF